MSHKPRGKGDPPNNNRGNKGGNGNGSGSAPNFSDSNAFGPPLGGRAKPNRNAGGSGPTPQSGPPPQSAWGNQQARSQPHPSAQPLQSAWGKPNNSAPAPQSAWGNQSARAPPAQQCQAPRAQQPPAQSAPSAWGRPANQAPPPQAPQSAWENQPSTSRAAPPSSGTVEPKKRDAQFESNGSAVKYHSDEKTRGEAARGAVHGNRSDRNEPVLQTKPETCLSKVGTTGTKFWVRANYFKLNSRLKWEIFHYHVEFVPEIESASFRNALLQRQREILGGFLYDRGSSIYTIQQLDNDVTDIQTRDRDEREILIKIKRVGLISPLESRSIQVLGVIMRKVQKLLDLKLIGRDHFDPCAKIEIRQHRIELWPGYSTSIRQHEQSLLMMAEIKHKLMRTETLLELLNQCYRESRDNFRQNFESQVIGMIVLTGFNNKTYRVTDVNFDITPKHTFETRDGPISYIDYYKKKYGKTIQDGGQPLLVSRPTEKAMRGAANQGQEAQLVNLVPELCQPTGYTDQMRKNFTLMKDVAEHTRVGPASRIDKLIRFNRRVRENQPSVGVLNDWSLDLEPNLVQIEARQLASEEIKLGEGRNVRAERGSWMNALQGTNSMYRSEDLPDNRWVFIIPERMRRDAEEFLKVLRQVSQGMRFAVGQPRVVYVPDDRTGTLSNCLAKECTQNPKMILIAVTNNQSDRYSAIKKVCTVQHAVPSQVVTARVMNPRDMRKMRSVATKVAIQMNSKIGGLPWAMDVKLNRIMFFGYDVCHDTRDKSRSYGALVATMDMNDPTNPKQRNRFFSTVNAHRDGQELSNFLTMGVKKALSQFKQLYGSLPERLMFYRDGVGEGQTNYVYQHELTNLVDSLKPLYAAAGKALKLGFIIVSKRINTKFFVESGRGPAENVPAGTVVDKVVTLPERYDFFLVSQHVTQGTATPTNYNVLYDTFGLPADKIQIMTYKMCHLYYNWSGTTRVPAVCQYAHKLAFLVGNYLHQSPHSGLTEYLHFL